MRFLHRLLALVLVATVGVIWATAAGAYPNYNGAPACVSCHPDFVKRGPLHDMHLIAISSCLLCHNSVGDNPPLSKCAGCHVQAGLVLHHTNAGAPPDGNGLTCATCHPGLVSDPENTAPPYYTNPDVSIMHPCSSMPPPGEDLSGDARGLDNDGDLLYDEQDPDCALANENSTWGRIKALYVE